jgi:hypothetical protein
MESIAKFAMGFLLGRADFIASHVTNICKI